MPPPARAITPRGTSKKAQLKWDPEPGSGADSSGMRLAAGASPSKMATYRVLFSAIRLTVPA